MKIEYPELPVSQKREEIVKLLLEHQVLVVLGETGSGKTTQLPKMAMEALATLKKGDPAVEKAVSEEEKAPFRVGCTQPRRLAATSVAKRVAEELKVEVGAEVGWQVRFTEVVSKETQLKFMTDGILLAETKGDPLLRQYDVIIIDEAHERSLNIDFLLGYLKRLLKKRPELKVVISSATLDAGRFSEFFHDAPVVEVEGRTFPVEDVFLEPSEDRALRESVFEGVQYVTDVDAEGDILVFLPGEREIRDTKEFLEGQGMRNTEVVPVFARLSLTEQERVFSSSSRRRVFLATNVAETSLTIPGIVSVVDTGLARVSRYHPTRQIQSLQVEMVSQASARQRRGRCGRVREGLCVKLYSEEALELAPEFTDPEIKRSALSGVILRMLSLKLGRVQDFPFLDPPGTKAINEGWKTLEEIGAMATAERRDEGATLSDIGWILARLPLDPRLGRMLIEGWRREVFEEVLIIVSGLAVMDVRERPQNKEQVADQKQRVFLDEKSDFGVFLNLWSALGEFRSEKGRMQGNKLRRFCKEFFLNYRRVMEWGSVYRELAQAVTRKGGIARLPKVSEEEAVKPRKKKGAPAKKDAAWFYGEVHKSVLVGIPRQVGYWDKEKRVYHGVANRDFAVFPGSGLFKAKRAPWLLGFELVETSRLWARKVAEIDPKWVEEVAPHLCQVKHHSPYWNEGQGAVYGREDVVMGGLKLVPGRPVFFGRINPKAAFEVFVQEALVEGRLRGQHPVLEHLQDLKGEILAAERKLRRVGFLWNEMTVYDFFFERLPVSVNTTKEFERFCQVPEQAAKLRPRFSDLIWEEGVEEEARLFPDVLKHSGKEWPLRYVSDPEENDDGVTVEIAVGELAAFPAYLLSWNVFGNRGELVEKLVRSLGKEMRVALHPIAEVVDDFLKAWDGWEPQCGLEQALREFLEERLAGSREIGEFSWANVPEYLRMKARVLDEDGSVLAFGEQIAELSEKVAPLLEERFQVAAEREWTSTGGTFWSFGAVPEEAAGCYPAVVDEGETVGTRAFFTAEEAYHEHRAGVVRLFRIEQDSQWKFVKRSLPLGLEAKLFLATYPDEEKRDLLRVAAEMAMRGNGGGLPRDEAAFAKAAERGRGDLFASAQEVCEVMEEVSTTVDEVRRALEALGDKGYFGEVQDSVGEQLEWLTSPGFVWRAGADEVRELPKYLRGILVRLKRLGTFPVSRDQKKEDKLQDEFQGWWQKWRYHQQDRALWSEGWRLEQLRYQLFVP